MRKIIIIALLCAGLYMASNTDKERLLVECVEGTEGTDADCERCYYEIYGEWPE